MYASYVESSGRLKIAWSFGLKSKKSMLTTLINALKKDMTLGGSRIVKRGTCRISWRLLIMLHNCCSMSVRKRLRAKSPRVSTVAETAKAEERESMILASLALVNWMGINLEQVKFGEIFLEVVIDWNFL